MIDFLTFKSFIAIDFFIFLYYIGALVIPLVIIIKVQDIYYRFEFIKYLYKTMERFLSKFGSKQQLFAIVGGISLFLFMEIIWRICFEMIIGYFQLIDSIKHIG